MQIYEFDKCLLERLQETMDVLSWRCPKIPASQVRKEWSYFIELQLEPAGWQALWKIPRLLCEQMNVRYPTVVLVYVEQVYFKEMKAELEIIAVQDEHIHLPTRHEVDLEDLYPTLEQENSALNVERTAECLDQIRFFYTHIWMPWDMDNDDQVNWVEKHLESRIRLCFDLKRGVIQRPLAAYIRSLIHEARYIYYRRQYLEMVTNDEEGVNLPDTTDQVDNLEELSTKRMRLCEMMRIHLRMTSIQSDFEMLENPETRAIYEHIKYSNLEVAQSEKTSPINYLVLTSHNIDKHMENLKIAKTLLSSKNSQVVVNHSLQDVLHICKPMDRIYLSPGRHPIHFSEYFNNDGILMGLVPPKPNRLLKSTNKSTGAKLLEEKSDKSEISTLFPSDKDEVTLCSSDDDSNLLIIDGKFRLENVVLDCYNVSHGMVIKKGEVIIKNCKFVGNGKSSIQEAIMCSGDSKLTIDQCHFENFATGINIGNKVSLYMYQTRFFNCNTGVDITDGARTIFEHVEFFESKICGIYYNALKMDPAVDEKHIVLKDLSDLERGDVKLSDVIPLKGKCLFKDCKDNVIIFNNAKGLVTQDTLEYIQHNTSDDMMQAYF